MSGLEWLRLEDLRPGAWDEFVSSHPAATFFHLSGFAPLFAKVLRQRPHYLAVRRGGELAGVLPLVEMRSPLFGRSLVSAPFLVEGGPLCVDEEVRDALLEAAERLARSLDARWIELRSPIDGRPGWQAGPELYHRFTVSLDPDPERTFNSFRRKRRASIRKGRSLGLRTRIGDDLAGFYDLVARNWHRLGTPILPRAWFAGLHSAFADRCEILFVDHGGRAVAAVMSFYFRDRVLPYYAGALPEARELCAHDVMYDALMRHATLVRGARILDFGRSRQGTGAYDFKRNWGIPSEPLRYSYRLLRVREPPAVNPTHPRLRLFIEAWKRLPFPVTLLLGPTIARTLG
ncbi:hypothetical protein HRbin40_02180 [bacterium HR40]|nr:hypothetical protein HRbin40_02180 [bacterium HR40]